MSKIIPSAEVKNHKRKNDLWMIIHNEVYDVSKFVDEHPGGVDTLLDLAGQDATEAFEDVGHSSDARALLKKYQIGTLPPDEQTKNSGTCAAVSPKPKKRSHSECSVCSSPSAPSTPRRAPTKTWRTFDGSPSSQSISPKSDYRPTAASRRVQAIVMPVQSSPRRRRGQPEVENTSDKKKYILIAAAAIAIIVIAVVAKKRME